MASETSLWFGVALVLSVLAPLAFLALIRGVERYGRESWVAVAGAFASGGVIAFPLALLIERLFVTQSGVDSAREVNLVFVAPIVEELLKAACVAAFWKTFTEPADGAVYGAGVGFGFAATENAGYALRTALESSGWSALTLASNRVITASVAHAVLTGSVGLGMAAWRTRHASALTIPAAVVVAVLIHAAYNRFSLAVDQNQVSPWFGVPIALAFWACVPLSAIGLRRLDGRTRRPPHLGDEGA